LFSPRSDYDAMIDVAAERHDVDPRLLKALVWKESGFDANAVGSRGEIGLTQLRMEHGAVAEWASARGEPPPPKGVLFRPEINLDIGAWYLSRALRHWEGFDRQYELALSEYNAGRTGMSPWIPESPDGEVLSNITIQSTKEYVRAVMERYRLYVAEREAE
jgi:soluble lytic murein transglycosylase